MTAALIPDLRRTGLDVCADALHETADLIVLAGGEGARRLFMAAQAAEHDAEHAPRVEVHGADAGAVAIGAAASGLRVALLASGPEWTPRLAPALRELARLGLGVQIIIPAHGDERGEALPQDSLDDAMRASDAPVCVGVVGTTGELGPCVRAMAAHARAIGRPCATVFSLARIGLAGAQAERHADPATNAVTLHGDAHAADAIVAAGEDLDEVLPRLAALGVTSLRAVRVNRLRPGLLPALAESLQGVTRVVVYEPFPGLMGDEGWLTLRVHRALEGRAKVTSLVRGDADDSRGYEDDETRALTFIPMDMRRRLDLAGLRVSLATWQAIDPGTRAALRDHPVDDAAAIADLASRVRAACDAVGAPAKEEPPTSRPWDGPEAWTLARERAASLGISLDVLVWQGLHASHRYALWHLASPKRDPARFRAALVTSGATAW